MSLADHKSRFHDTPVKRTNDDDDDDDGDDDEMMLMMMMIINGKGNGPLATRYGFFGVGHWGRTYAIKSSETTPL